MDCKPKTMDCKMPSKEVQKKVQPISQASSVASSCGSTRSSPTASRWTSRHLMASSGSSCPQTPPGNSLATLEKGGFCEP
uniref:Uncharacterized protein n=1 Tax=Romanomermis culicivorax TaxID=13658 RepID=A0A915I6K5_ROMCU